MMTSWAVRSNLKPGNGRWSLKIDLFGYIMLGLVASCNFQGLFFQSELLIANENLQKLQNLGSPIGGGDLGLLKFVRLP